MKWCALLVLLSAGRALAHGPPVGATELLAHDGAEVSLVRLTRGFVSRAPDGMHFLCPEAFGSNLLVPAAALANGPMLVAGETLFVVQPDGGFAPHPVQSGTGFAAATHGDAVFVVFHRDAQWELRRVTKDTNQLVRTLAQPVDALAVSPEEVHSLRYQDRTVVVETFSLAGEPKRSVTWQAESFVADAELRWADGLYAVVWGRSAPWVSLGRVADGHEPLLHGNVDIAGPVAGLVSVDGSLRTLEGAAIDTRGERVTCLAQTDGEAYACAHQDLVRVDATGLGAPRFEMSKLKEPSYEGLDDAQRADCKVRWLDVGVDLAAARGDAGVTTGDAAAASDAGPPEAAAGGCRMVTGGGSNALLILLCALRRRVRAPCPGSASLADRTRA